jgi:hypothetical protein
LATRLGLLTQARIVVGGIADPTPWWLSRDRGPR